MDAIILSAGQGSRLNIGVPKCMVDLNNEKLIVRTLKILREVNGIKNIRIVVGHGGVWTRAFQTKVKEISNNYSSEVLINKYSMESQSIESLKVGMKSYSEFNDLLVLDGDLVFDRLIIDGISKQAMTSLLVSESENQGSKVKFRTTNNNINTLENISESIDSKYVYTGIMMINKSDALIFDEFIRENDYRNKVMAQLLDDISKFISIQCILVPSCETIGGIRGHIFNINTKKDLDNAIEGILK